MTNYDFTCSISASRKILLYVLVLLDFILTTNTCGLGPGWDRRVAERRCWICELPTPSSVRRDGSVLIDRREYGTAGVGYRAVRKLQSIDVRGRILAVAQGISLVF